MKRKNPEEILSAIIQKIEEAKTDGEIFDNLQLNVQDTSSADAETGESTKEYLKRHFQDKYGRTVSGEYVTSIDVVITKEAAEIEIRNETIFICGRYRKNKRGISNTPMVFGGGKVHRRRGGKERGGSNKDGKDGKNRKNSARNCNSAEKGQNDKHMENAGDFSNDANNTSSHTASSNSKSTFNDGNAEISSNNTSGNNDLTSCEARMPAVSDWMEPLRAYFRAEKTVFISGGREDYDVRMLGNGRPFLCRIENPSCNLPKRVGVLSTVISETGDAVEEYSVVYKPFEIPYGMSSEVELIDMYLVDGSRAMKDMKMIEEEHCKEYGVLVHTKAARETVEQKIASSYWEETEGYYALKSPNLLLAQKTPIRVMHRRANLTRDKILHTCKILVDKESSKEGTALQMEIKSSSGTYIKEFVNGDMGRTSPSMSEIVGEYCDVVELDVLGIEDTFPSSEYIHAPVHLILHK
ncbi:tRNA pseudouridine synthase 10 [Nematocida minor]|uniref:tRNA pseudouridine synthase 10 n=1 Tax=Nematocida minor TaxID=1912983 RepID=UPI00221FA27A|nr:tRNA pseudouridine synthase 10 [Nematocida minor]KAI5190090.1 tRNA pseudouridine synthase 10 [Nematocida minor]